MFVYLKCLFELCMRTCFELYMRTCSVFQNIWSWVPKGFLVVLTKHANGAVPGKTVSRVLDGTAQFIYKGGRQFKQYLQMWRNLKRGFIIVGKY